jgi:hypothetical protein
MKKIISILSILILSTVSFAHADSGDGSGNDSRDSSGGYNVWTYTGLGVLGFTAGVVGILLTAKFEGKEAYVQNLREDAADYLANGTESALLAEAIQDVRAVLESESRNLQSEASENSASDAAIAAGLLSAQ